MTRRDAIKKTAWLTGCAVSATTVAAVLAGCKADVSDSWEGKVLSSSQYEAVSELAEFILPKTNTPGAKDVFVGRFIDEMLAGFYEEKEKTSFILGLNSCMTYASDTFSKPLAELNKDEIKLVMDELIRQAKSETEKQKDDDDPIKPFFLQLKHLSMLGYYTCEEISTNVLVFDPVPGDYDGCYPLEETGGRAWAI